MLAGPVVPAARGLLGCTLTANDVTVRITETEAYAGTAGDPASHAYRGRTPRNAVMFGPAGHVYVYFVFGMHWCANIVCGRDGEAAAVLLRAGEVVDGIETARERRPRAADRDLARGPARLVTALGLGRDANGTSAIDGSGPLLLTPPASPVDPARILAGPRVGVAAAHDLPWRFWLADEPSVSVYRRHTPRRRPATAVPIRDSPA
ncbi:DNA-3-methyladenine glycosylase [Micromonospora sp. NPDC005222]|uniref:DNA-3-methyladenine glycosylase n=1 Tax=unclassified Micromonospora TaxID=2617518 RepID=UPI0033ADB3D5